MNATCTKCFTEQPIENFPWKNKLLGIRHRVCKTCTAARSRRIYRDNPEPQKERVKANNRSYVRQLREYVWQYLATHPCVDCGESDPIVLEFDHRGSKRELVSTLVGNGHTLKAIQDEIAKCEVRCANCHRKKTAKQFNWYGWLGKN